MTKPNARLLEKPGTPLQEVFVCLSLSGVEIKKADGASLLIPLAEIVEMSQVSSIWRVAAHRLDSVSNTLVPVILLLDQESTFQEILAAWKRSNPMASQRKMSAEGKLLLIKMSTLLLLLIGFAFASYIAFLNLYRVVPTSFDQRLGNMIHTTSFAGQRTCTDSALNSFIRKAGQDLTQKDDLFTHDILLVDDTTQNAFAIPGGRVYLHRGLLQISGSPDAILGVLAHEISHGELRHGIQQLWRQAGVTLLLAVTVDPSAVTQLAANLATLKYSRDFERQADFAAIERLHLAHLSVSPLGAVVGGDTLVPSWLSTHPGGRARAEIFRAAALKENFIPNPDFQWEREHWSTLRLACNAR